MIIKRKQPLLFQLSLVTILSSMALALVSTNDAKAMHLHKSYFMTPPDSTQKKDTTTKMPFPIKDKKPWETTVSKNPFDLNDPPNIKTKYELDSEKNQYNVSSKVGNYNTKPNN